MDYNRDLEMMRAQRAAERAEEQAQRGAWEALRPLPALTARRVLVKMLADFDDGYSLFGVQSAGAAASGAAPHGEDVDEADDGDDDDGAESTGDVDTDVGFMSEGELFRSVLRESPVALRAPEIRALVERFAPGMPHHKLSQWLHRTKDTELVVRGEPGRFYYALKDTPAASAPMPRKARKDTRSSIHMSDEAARAKLVDVLSRRPSADYQWLTEQVFGTCTSELRMKVRNYLHYLAGRPTPLVLRRTDGAWEAVLERGGIKSPVNGGTMSP